MTAGLRTGSSTPIVLLAGTAAGLLAVVAAELGPLFAAVALIAAGIFVFAFMRPLWALYAAILVIPLERLATSFGALTFSPTEALLSATAIAWVIRRLLDGNLTWRKSPLTAPLALFTLSVIPGLLIAVDKAVVAKQLGSGILIFVCFLVLISEGTREDARRMAFVVAIVGAIVGAIAIASPPVQSNVRVQGPFTQANTLGQFIALSVPLQIAFAVSSRGLVRFLMAGACLVAIAGLIASGSRGSLVGIAAMAIVLLAWRPFRYASLVAVFLCVPFALVGFGPFGSLPQLTELKERFLRIGTPGDESSKQRMDIYRKTPQMVIEHPLFGVGASNFYAAAPEYDMVLPNSRYAQAHDTPLAIAAERGMLGLGALIWFVVVLTGMIRRVLRRAPPDMSALAWGLAGAFAGQLIITLFEYSIPAAPVTLTTLCLAGCVAILDSVLAHGRSTAEQRRDTPPLPGAAVNGSRIPVPAGAPGP